MNSCALSSAAASTNPYAILRLRSIEELTYAVSSFYSPANGFWDGKPKEATDEAKLAKKFFRQQVRSTAPQLRCSLLFLVNLLLLAFSLTLYLFVLVACCIATALTFVYDVEQDELMDVCLHKYGQQTGGVGYLPPGARETAGGGADIATEVTRCILASQVLPDVGSLRGSLC